MRALVVLAALLMSSPTFAAAQTAEPAIVAEARSFMEGYARDLLGGDRPAIAARYDRDGAWMVHAGESRLVCRSCRCVYEGQNDLLLLLHYQPDAVC